MGQELGHKLLYNIVPSSLSSWNVRIIIPISQQGGGRRRNQYSPQRPFQCDTAGSTALVVTFVTLAVAPQRGPQIGGGWRYSAPPQTVLCSGASLSPDLGHSFLQFNFCPCVIVPVGFVERIHVSSLYFVRCWVPGKIVLEVLSSWEHCELFTQTFSYFLDEAGAILTRSEELLTVSTVRSWYWSSGWSYPPALVQNKLRSGIWWSPMIHEPWYRVHVSLCRLCAFWCVIQGTGSLNLGLSLKYSW